MSMTAAECRRLRDLDRAFNNPGEPDLPLPPPYAPFFGGQAWMEEVFNNIRRLTSPNPQSIMADEEPGVIPNTETGPAPVGVNHYARAERVSTPDQRRRMGVALDHSNQVSVEEMDRQMLELERQVNANPNIVVTRLHSRLLIED